MITVTNAGSMVCHIWKIILLNGRLLIANALVVDRYTVLGLNLIARYLTTSPIRHVAVHKLEWLEKLNGK